MFSRLVTVLSTVLAVTTMSVSAALSDCRINPNTTDPAITRALAGRWFVESFEASVNMKSKTIEEYLPTGVWSYQQENCSTLSGYTTCSQAQGHGLWMATKQSNGIFITVKILGDTSGRQNICPGWAVSFRDANTFINQRGGIFRRLR